MPDELAKLSSQEIKEAMLYKLVTIAVQTASDPRDVDDLGKLVSALARATMEHR
jgi:hypothetical protein